METKNEADAYQWILNEGLLRDEGTLFGIAGAATKDKIAAIRDYYRIKKAAAQTKRHQLEKEVEQLRGELSKERAESGGAANSRRSMNLAPTVLQVGLYGGICFFNYYLEVYWLSPVLHSTFICVGLYLFGLFPVFSGRSILYNRARALYAEEATGEQRENWKMYFEEFGVPLAVAGFISVLPAKAYPLSYSILAALVFFMLFLLSGKGLVNTFFKIQAEAGCWWQVVRRRRERKKQFKKLEILENERGLVAAELEALEGEEDYRINIFTSEYQLAFESRQLAGNGSLKKLA